MKLLLFDQNISPRLVNTLADIYPNSVHASAIGMGSALDVEIWVSLESSKAFRQKSFG